MEAPVLDVSSWLPSDDEWLGDQEKVWLTEPFGSRNVSRTAWLFKPSRRTPLPGRRGEPSRMFTWFDAGSEWIAHQLAVSIGVPSAEIRLAQRADAFGALSRSVRPPSDDLQGGDVFLSEALGRDYVPNAEKARNRRGHNLEAIGGDDERDVVAAVPGLSELRRTFVCRLLEENRRRLLTP